MGLWCLPEFGLQGRAAEGANRSLCAEPVGSVQGMCWSPAAIPLALTSVVEALSGAPSLSEAWLGTAQPSSPMVLGVCCVCSALLALQMSVQMTDVSPGLSLPCLCFPLLIYVQMDREVQRP